jgi:transcriptional regulator with XRE-family HTH domain
LSNSSSMRVRDAPAPPSVEPLGGEAEGLSDELGADRLDQVVVGVRVRGHTPEYQHSVYISRGQTFIGLAAAVMHKLRVAHDPAFGERLRHYIARSEYKNPRRFAIGGMGWPEDSGAQRLNQYLKGRIPDVETLLAMSDAINVSVSDLLGLHGPSSAPDEGLRGILQHLLALEGIEADRADTIASALLGAQRLLRAFPDEEPLPTRAKFAARAAWLQQQSPTPNT